MVVEILVVGSLFSYHFQSPIDESDDSLLDMTPPGEGGNVSCSGLKPSREMSDTEPRFLHVFPIEFTGFPSPDDVITAARPSVPSKGSKI